jgi:hypothetical protein
LKQSAVTFLNYGGDTVAIRSSRSVGGLTVAKASPVAAGWANASAFATPGHLAPCERVAVLLFSPGADLRHNSVTAAVTKGSVSVRTTAGSGSLVMAVADRADEGIAFSVGSLGAGRSEWDAKFSSGVVGGTSAMCSACVGSWTAPDARTGSWQQLGDSIGGDDVFAGPAGKWAFEWSGATAPGPGLPTSDPQVVAVVPVGASWTLFDRKSSA